MFTKANNNKVKFQDQQLDDYVLENSVLKSKLQSKIDALSIMNKELDKCCMERDRYKVLVEQFKCKQTVATHEVITNKRFSLISNISGGEMLAKTRDHNKLLQLEVETLRNKLEEATGDIMALRKQLYKEVSDDRNSTKKSSTDMFSTKDYENLVHELEKIKKKYQQIQLDYRATLDEKEELVSDRDYYKGKVQRLNHQMSYILSNRLNNQKDNTADPPKPIVDLDALVTENKYLHERITQLQVEQEILKRTLTKYKSLLDNRHKNNQYNLKKGYADVMTPKQVREFLDKNSSTGLKRSSAAELKSLCLGLFEALNDKSIALQHQRKTNQILANRINELEKTLESWCNGQKCIPIFPSHMLLDEILPEGSMKFDDNDKCVEGNGVEKKHGESEESLSFSEDGKEKSDGTISNKTVLPYELEELVKKALAEIKPVD